MNKTKFIQSPSRLLITTFIVMFAFIIGGVALENVVGRNISKWLIIAGGCACAAGFSATILWSLALHCLKLKKQDRKWFITGVLVCVISFVTPFFIKGGFYSENLMGLFFLAALFSPIAVYLLWLIWRNKHLVTLEKIRAIPKVIAGIFSLGCFVGICIFVLYVCWEFIGSGSDIIKKAPIPSFISDNMSCWEKVQQTEPSLFEKARIQHPASKIPNDGEGYFRPYEGEIVWFNPTNDSEVQTKLRMFRLSGILTDPCPYFSYTQNLEFRFNRIQ